MGELLGPTRWVRGSAHFCMLAVVAGAFFGLAVEQAFAGRVISNGTVALGVNDPGQLNFNDGTRFVGVTYEPTGNDGTRAGCQCEGWGAGVADPGGNFSGFAYTRDTGPSGTNLDPVSFVSTASTATSIVTIDDQLRVTHAFAPSPSTPNLYEINVTLENIGATALPDVRYTRSMDWDVEPTAFSEFVTIQGADPQPDALIHSNDNGFANADPFSSHPPLDPATENADYTDKGPADHGALFDFTFGALAVGEEKEFSIFYGAAGNETAANAAVSAVGAELFSYGQPNGGQVTGAPNTFIWGFKAVGGEPVIPPTLTLTPQNATNPVGTSHTLTAELENSSGNPVPGAPIVFKVNGANPRPPATRTTAANGRATFTYTGTSAGGDTIRACLDNNENGACDPDEVADNASKTWGDEAPPTYGETVDIEPVSGTVCFKPPGANECQVLVAGQQVPTGSIINTTQGRVRLTAAQGPGGVQQTGVFYDGVFKVIQPEDGPPITELNLLGFSPSDCTASSARGSVLRRRSGLWGRARGRFRTRGRRGSASIRGTLWFTEDRCDGTYFEAREGAVTIRDFTRGRTVILRAGQNYLAPAVGTVEAGNDFSCGVRPAGALICWGDNTFGKATPPGGTFEAVSAGGSHACGIRTNNAVDCWGANGLGQTNAPPGSFTAVSAGADHSCALRPIGTVVCWGRDGSGQATPPRGSFEAVSAGGFHTCALRTGNTLACWGNDEFGQATPFGGAFSAVSAGGFHTCGLRPNGTLSCWGRNAVGQATPPGGTFEAVSAGGSHACGIRTSNLLACWGRNGSGQATPPDGTFSVVSAGGTHTCGLRSSGTAFCWGSTSPD